MEFPQSEALASRFEVLDESVSTNAALTVLSADVDAWPHLSVVVTDNQTGGRGRLDRTWQTPAGSALAVSVLLRELPADAVAMGWVPLVAGLAMADSVTVQLPGHDVGVKWPNDVLVNGRKICGILAESTGSAIVLGAGVNTSMTAEQLPVPTATSFAALGAFVDEDRLIADYLRRLDGLLSALVAWGDAERSGVHAAVSARCATIGRDVEVSLPDGSAVVGTAIRLEADGRLCVSSADGERLVAAGDVVHARLA